MNKKPAFIILLAAFAISLLMAFAGCSLSGRSTDSSDPYAIIKEAYGTQEFTITFNSENLSEPIDDITYTAYNMPTLPTPKRVGYVFDGWYFDESYSIAYFDDVLYLYMCDVTLYAKWVKEELVQDGVYDISVSLEVIEGSISKNSLADKYGNSPEYFLSDVDTEAFQIEKVGEQILLKFVYNVRTISSFGGAEMYSVGVSSLMGSSVYIAESVTAQVETERTLYFDITEIDLEDTVYLTVAAYKWDAEVEEDENIDNTRISFTLAVTITEFDGLTGAYADPDITLEDGYYSVKTHFDSDMMSSYDPVYSYIIAEDGNYTLIKPFTPYTGYVGEDFSTDYYYYITTAMMPAQYYYTVDEAGSASAYKPMQIEYHADTGRYYYVYDLGDNVKQDIVFCFVIGGPMQYLLHYGSSEMTLTVGYDQLIAVSDTGYTPLSGDAYCYSESFTTITSDDYSASEYNIIEDYGTSVPFINFFYSTAAGANTMYSHTITITPADGVASASDTQTATFSFSASIYGYDPTAGSTLYANLFTDGYLTGTAYWGNQKMISGMSVEEGEEVDLEELFYQKVSPSVDFSSAEILMYEMDGNDADYSSVYDWGGGTKFNFSQSVAVVYTFAATDEDGAVTGTNTAVVQLRLYSEPNIYFEDDFSYDEDATYTQGNITHYYADTIYASGLNVSYPDLYYEWYSAQGNFIGIYSATSSDYSIHPIYVTTWRVSDGEYTYSSLTLSGNGTRFSMVSGEVVVMYELRNDYGERHYAYIHFYSTATQTIEYSVQRDGEVLISGTVTSSGGTVSAVSHTQSVSGLLGSYEEVQLMLAAEYTFVLGGESKPMSLAEAEVYTPSTVETFSEGEIEEDILNLLVTADYAVLILTYSDGYNSFTIRYAYKMYVDGSDVYVALSYDTLFTGTEYYIDRPAVTDESGLVLGTGTVSVEYFGSADDAYTLTASNSGYIVTFAEVGQYTITYSAYLRYTDSGERVFNRDGYRFMTTYIRVTQTVTVEDSTGTVTVTYVTDAEHPFTDGELTYTQTYRLTGNIYLLTADTLQSGSDVLNGWGLRNDYNITDSSYIYSPGYTVTNFIGTFNSNNVTLYAVWDSKVTVTLSYYTVSGGEYTEGGELTVRTYSASDGRYSIYVYIYLQYANNQLNYLNGYTLVGFTGGFFGDEIVENYENWTSYTSYSVYEPGQYNIYAIFAKQHTVSYDTGYRTYTGTYYGNESVVEGETVGEEKTVTPYEGYAFAGWCVRTAEENYTAEDIVNFTEYVITEDVTFVALYYDAEGNLVW